MEIINKKINIRKEGKTMKNTLKKVIAVLTAVTMVMALGVVSNAADPEPDLTITVHRPDEDEAEHTYTAYRIFSGKIEEDTTTNPATRKLVSLGWGAGVDSASLIAHTDGTIFEGLTEAAEFAAKIEEAPEANALAFETLVSQYLGTGVEKKTSDNPAELTVTGYGYYLITDKVANEDYGAASKFMLKVVDIHTSATIEAKEALPSLTKKIDQGSGVEANTAGVGEKVPFVLTSTVPDLRNKGYNRYWFVIKDTLSKGLEFNDSVAITIGDTTLDASAYSVSSSTDPDTGVTTVTIAIKDFLDNYGTDDEYVGKQITVKYDATLTKDCDMTTTGNPNIAQLIFSNDPSEEYDGDKPSENSTKPVGVSPEQKTVTYTTGIVIIKVDDSGNRLKGAKFSIDSEDSTSKQVVTEKEVFVEDDTNGTYYKLKNGKYTTDAPADPLPDEYESAKKYSKTVTRDTLGDSSAAKMHSEAVVGDEGILIFEGLGTGTYVITEVEAPAGYIKSNVSHTVVIGTTGATLTSPNWTYKLDTDDVTNVAITLTIENIKSSDLPETGGIGTTIFYIAGSILLVAGAALCISKNKILKDGKK